jgi:uncharacterized protein
LLFIADCQLVLILSGAFLPFLRFVSAAPGRLGGMVRPSIHFPFDFPLYPYILVIYMNVWTECVGFEWDKGNAGKNWEKHRVADIEREELLFNQPLIVRADPKHSRQERHFYALGQTDRKRQLFVVFTVRRRLTRTISAREMNRKERASYENYESQEKPESPSDL